MAYEDDIIVKNPFDFVLTSVVRNDTQHRVALTPDQQTVWMDFVRFDTVYRKYYDEFVILLETGMRVSEFCGLTLNDLDFEKRRICVDHQLLRDRDGTYHVEKTKTESGCRFIPMTDRVVKSLEVLLARRQAQKNNWIIDGYSNFLLLDKNSRPKVALHVEHEMQWALKKYNRLHPDEPLPHITPHIMRHTFCTNMANAGMDIKSLQYLMGHSDAGVTMNVYSHATYEHAAGAMRRLKIGESHSQDELERSIV
ncbi:MAG: site-specific integrase [Clostridia bacterium]|nr:site-specific integrase [Clostridia bacterium]